MLGLSLYGGGDEMDCYLLRPEMLDEPEEPMGDANVDWVTEAEGAVGANVRW